MQLRRAETTDEEALAHVRRSVILALAVPTMSREQAEQLRTMWPAGCRGSISVAERLDRGCGLTEA